MAIGHNIRMLREKYGLSQKELAQIAGVSDKAVSTWETGKKDPRMGAIEKIAAHFGILKSAIIEDSESLQFTVSPVEREHIKKYRALTEEQREAVDGLINHFFDRNNAASVTRSGGMIEVTIPVVEDERAKLHRLLDEELDKEKEGRRASSYGKSVTGTK